VVRQKKLWKMKDSNKEIIEIEKMKKLKIVMRRMLRGKGNNELSI